MGKLQYGDLIKLPDKARQLKIIADVVPVKYNSIEESWIVCEQSNATHMLIVTLESIQGIEEVGYIMIEIGKCENLYLLADAMVD
jgi:hypothetical protein